MDREEILEAHYRLHEHVRFLHAYWATFRAIFRAPAEKQTLLTTAIPQFFVLLEKALIRLVFLEFRLLTEKPITNSRRNASLRGVLDAVHGSTWEQTNAAGWISAIEDNSTVRLHANRVIAHIDWNVAAGNEEPPGAVSLDQVEEALLLVRQVMAHLADELQLRQRDYTEAHIDNEIESLFALLASLPAS
jgi:hypothetical protein